LRHIRDIEIVDYGQNLTRRIIKSESSRTPEYEVYRIQEYENETLKNEDAWLTFRRTSEVPLVVKVDYVTKEWEREAVQKREVVAAFRLDEEGKLLKEEKGTAHIGVFSFLPLKEVPSGLNFLLQADFLTSPGRGELARDCLWNDWLAGEIYSLVVERCLPVFLGHDMWKMNFADVLHSAEGGHELFETHLKGPLNEYIENNAVLIAEDGSLATAQQLVRADEEIRELLSEEDLKVLYPDKKIMHKECMPHGQAPIQEAPKDVYAFITSSESERLIRLKAKKRDVAWFTKLYSMLVQKYDWEYFYHRYYHYNVEHDDFWNRIRSLHRPIILTSNYDVVTIGDCYLNSNKVRIPRQLKRRFNIVHPQIAKDDTFDKFRKKLNENKAFKELVEQDVKDALQRQEALEMDKDKWQKLSDEERAKKIRELWRLWSQYSIPLEQYDFLTLRSKTGEWLKPEELVFSCEYKPAHNLEILASKKLLDVPLKFLSPEFIDNVASEDEIRAWRRFFENMDVDRIVESEREAGGKRGGLVHRIGVLSALQYEERRKRSPRELGESEKLGYDIESKSKTEERSIEVKATSDSSYDIFLTVNEFRVLRGKQEKYFIYVVLDALRNPTVSVTRGDKLLEIEDVRILVPFGKWKGLVEDEFQP